MDELFDIFARDQRQVEESARENDNARDSDHFDDRFDDRNNDNAAVFVDDLRSDAAAPLDQHHARNNRLEDVNAIANVGRARVADGAVAQSGAVERQFQRYAARIAELERTCASVQAQRDDAQRHATARDVQLASVQHNVDALRERCASGERRERRLARARSDAISALVELCRTSTSLAALQVLDNDATSTAHAKPSTTTTSTATTTTAAATAAAASASDATLRQLVEQVERCGAQLHRELTDAHRSTSQSSQSTATTSTAAAADADAVGGGVDDALASGVASTRRALDVLLRGIDERQLALLGALRVAQRRTVEAETRAQANLATRDESRAACAALSRVVDDSHATLAAALERVERAESMLQEERAARQRADAECAKAKRNVSDATQRARALEASVEQQRRALDDELAQRVARELDVRRAELDSSMAQSLEAQRREALTTLAEERQNHDAELERRAAIAGSSDECVFCVLMQSI